MLELKPFVPKLKRNPPAGPRSGGSHLPSPQPARSRQDSPEQRRMMVIAFSLLLAALAVVLYQDRNFWFPGTQQAPETDAQPQPQEPAPAASPSLPLPLLSRAQEFVSPPRPPVRQSSKTAKTQPKAIAPAKALPPDPSAASTAAAPPFTVETRTVLPPLEIEVVAGDVHRTVHPGVNSVRVDLQPGTPAQPSSDGPALGIDAKDASASAATNAAERVQVFADTAEIVSRPVQPGYPLLARQMKVQGSVILQALIGRDGLIQDLRVLSGPPILANAAQEAVKQWHFKPHYQGLDAVETQARITVNFTISTN